METKLVQVPFNLEMAKRIQNGEVEGRIVTRDGRSARIVCWDVKHTYYNIGCLVLNCNEEIYRAYTSEGEFNSGDVNEIDLILEIPEYLTFKDGDLLVDKYENIFIYNGNTTGITFGCYAGIIDELVFRDKDYKEFTTAEGCRLATSEERKHFIEALKESTEPQAKEYLKRFFGIELSNSSKIGKDCEFKTFDKVLVRNDECLQWGARFFDRMYEGDYACTDSLIYKYCIPYEGNEHLNGTTENPE